MRNTKNKGIEVNTNRYVYHASNTIFRDNIKSEGLIVKGKSETWLSDTKINGKVIFASNSNKRSDWFNSTYDDDIYEIDTSLIKNKWYQDPNFLSDKYIITYENIPINAIKLIYKGSQEDSKYIKPSDAKKVIYPSNPNIIFMSGGNVLLAPNGQPSNLTPEQYRLVRTPAFKKWFGDWENSPETASKVIDENGEPLVVYHGSNDIITEFNSDYSYYGEFWFSRNKEKILKGESGASGIKYILPCFLNIKKMAGWNEYQNLYTDQRIQMGYDGTNIDEDYIAYEPNQIKLADGTNTTFDGNNPDIRYANGGGVGIDEIGKYDKFKSRWDKVSEYGDLEINNPLRCETYLFPNEKGFLIELFYNNLLIGSFHSFVDEEGQMNDAEILEQFQNKGFGKILLLKAIDVSNLYLGYFGTDIRGITAQQQKVYDSLSKEGIISGYGSSLDNEKAQDKINSIIKKFDANNPDIRYANGGVIETLTTEQVEQKLGRKLHWWNDDVVLIKGVLYKKVFLRPEYQKI